MSAKGLAAPSHYRRIALAAMLLSLAACATDRPAAPDQAALRAEAAFQRQLALEDKIDTRRRIENVSFHLMAAASPFCSGQQGAAYGFTVANRDSFGPGMAEAAATVGLDGSARVLSVVPDSPAAAAGLETGDVVTRINGQPVEPGSDSAAQVSRAVREAAFAGLTLHIGGANPRRLQIEPVAACDYAIEVQNTDKVNAYADGDRIRITKGMLWFVRDETELGMVLSHELAHNVMGHAGTFSGVFYDKKSREAEADYVGLYIMARGGFDIERAPNFWRRLAAAFPGMIDSSSSHPVMPYRFVALVETTEEIRGKQARGEALVPALDRGPGSPGTAPDG